MAVENTLITKGIIGLSALVGSGTSCLIFKHKLHELFYSDVNHQSFLIVQLKAETTKPDVDLFKNGVKNFKCKEGTDAKNEDATCELYKLKTSEKTKYLDIDQVRNASEKITKMSDLATDNTYYKLTIDETKFKTNTKFDGTYLIDIDSTITGEAKKYAKLKVVARVEKQEIKSENKLVIAKLKENNIDESTTGFQCKLGDVTPKISCDIYQFSSDLKNLKDLSFSTQTTKVDNPKTKPITIYSYYIIDFSGETTNHAQLTLDNLKKTIVFGKSDDSKKASFSPVRTFIGKHKETENKAFVLNKFSLSTK